MLIYLERQVTFDEGSKLAQKHGYFFTEISCKEGTNLNCIIKMLLETYVSITV